MKYVILVTDGAADEPIPSLHGKTALEAAPMPTADGLAARGMVGTVQTVPDGMAPGSDVANLALMGYDPKIFHTGRSPLEAASIGVDLKPTDVAYRCNIVTLIGDGPYEEKIILDHAAGDIPTADARILMDAVAEELGTDTIHFYTGVSYRHCMVVENGRLDYCLTPPHDILDHVIGDYLPKEPEAGFLLDLMKRSYEILSTHPINRAREAKGLRPANSIWLWGQGKKPALSPLEEKYHVKGSAISAVDLIKGIAICAGMATPDVPGATGTVNTDYESKLRTALSELKRGQDFVYIHMEGPDESSHQGSLPDKLTSLERIDSRILKPLVQALEASGEPYRILLAPDHYTPLRIRTHMAHPVPFVLFDSETAHEPIPSQTYGETSGASGMAFADACQLIDFFFCKDK